MMTTFGDPSADASGNPPTTSTTQTSGSSETSSDTEMGSGSDSSGGNTSNATTDPSSDSSGSPADEQPEDGMYSECATVADCIGQTTCVIVPGAPMGFCSHACADAGTDCTPNPGATSNAAPACVDDGNGMQVCALSCDGGLTCPGGMECASLGASMVCV